jgi:hypothetical protein
MELPAYALHRCAPSVHAPRLKAPERENIFCQCACQLDRQQLRL